MNEIDQLQQTLNKARRALALLEEQMAGYGSLNVPVDKQIELEDKRAEVQTLQTRLQSAIQKGQLSGEYAGANTKLSGLLLELEKANAREDWDKVISAGKKILAIDGETPQVREKMAEAHIMRGHAFRVAGRNAYDTKTGYLAIVEYNLAIQYNPEEPEYFYWRGLCYHNIGDYDEAIESFKAGLELKPYSDFATKLRGLLTNTEYDKRYYTGELVNEYQDYIGLYSLRIQKDPTPRADHFIRGAAYFYTGKYAEAIEDFNLLLKTGPNNARTYFARAKCYELQGNHILARADYKRADELGHKYARWHLKNL